MSVVVPNQTVAITRDNLPTPDFRRWQLAITDAVNTPAEAAPVEPTMGDFLPLSTFVKGVDGIAFYGALSTGGVLLGLETLADSGTGALLGITRDAYGRVSGTTDATITGTAGEIDVANGDAVAGPPTLSLADVADAGGGTLQKTAFDTKGRKTGTSAVTASDVPIVDAGGYFTGTDVEAALQELGAGGGGGADPPNALSDPIYDFLGKPPTSTTAAAGASYPWVAARIGTGGSITSIDGGATAPGVWRLDCGTSAFTSIQMGDANNMRIGAGLIRLPFRFRTPTLSDGTNRYNIDIGMRDSWSGPTNERIAIRYKDDENSGKLQIAATLAGSVTTAAGTTTVAADTWISGYLEINAAGTEAYLYVGGALEATLSSGLPTGVMAIGAGIFRASGSTARQFDLDYFGPPQITFTAAR